MPLAQSSDHPPLLTPVANQRRAVSYRLYNDVLNHPFTRLMLGHLVMLDVPFSGERMIEAMACGANFPTLSVGDLLTAVRAAGVAAQCVSISIKELVALSLPMLVYIREAQKQQVVAPAVIESIDGDTVRLRTDRVHSENLSITQLASRWTGICMTVSRAKQIPPTKSYELTAYRNQIKIVHNLLSSEACRDLISYCESKSFALSKVGTDDGGELVNSRVRNSMSAVLSDRSHPLLAPIYKQFAELENVAQERIEDLQCVKYMVDQKFAPHLDSANPVPRRTTYLLYLNDDFQGGCTTFPLLGLSVLPKEGSCLRFLSCEDNGRSIWMSEHGGDPVISGTKYALNIWVRPPYMLDLDCADCSDPPLATRAT